MQPLLTPDDPIRKYDVFKLHNDLVVLTISDPETAVSGASMDVNVGSMSDPDDLQGLAHFIEHMLFLGTMTYPEEDHYRNLLAEHSGRSNAYTSMENTNYQFDVASTHFREILDVFASFFTCPLFTASATERELKAIDSEHSKNLQNEGFRNFQFYKDIANPNHPFSKFATGNLDTLKTKPEAAGIDSRDRMIAHYREHYSSNLMKLVLYGKESNETLKQWATQFFSDIPNKELHHIKSIVPVYTPKELGYWYKLVPVQTTRSISLTFPMASVPERYLTKEHEYLGHLLGHESEGSIFYYLQSKRWAEALSSGPGIAGRDFMLFNISIELTELGFNHIEDIIFACFQYIAMLKRTELQDYVYQEVSDICSMMFKFLEPYDPFSYTTQVAADMNRFAPEHALSGSYLHFEYNKKAIYDALGYLTPENMLLVTKAPEYEEECTELSSPYYDTKHSKTPITETQLNKWRSASDVASKCQFHLPTPNRFIPKSFDLKPVPADPVDIPQLIHESESPSMTVWYKQDNRHLKPKAEVRWRLITKLAYIHPRLRLLSRFFGLLVKEKLNALTYYASMANLEYYFEASTEGFLVYVDGFNDCMGELSKAIFSTMREVTIDEDTFVKIKGQVAKLTENFKKSQPYQIALQIGGCAIEQGKWIYDDTWPLIEGITCEEFRAFIPTVLKQFRVEGYIHGNILKEEALAIVAEVEKEFLQGIISHGSVLEPELRVFKVPVGKECVLLHKDEHNPKNDNSALFCDFQIGDTSCKTILLGKIFTTIVESAFFGQLRTVETMGYIVSSFLYNRGIIFSVAFIVQSSKHDPMYMYSRVYRFLQAFGDFLASYEDLDSVVASQIALRKEKPKTLKLEAQQHQVEIESAQFLWDRQEVEIEVLKTITKSDLLLFWETYISNEAPQKRRLSTFLYSSTHYPEYDKLMATIDSTAAELENKKKTSNPFRYKIEVPVTLALPPYQNITAEANPSEFMDCLFMKKLASDQRAILLQAPVQALQQLSQLPEDVQEQLASQYNAASNKELNAFVAEFKASVDETEDKNVTSPVPTIEKYNNTNTDIEFNFIRDIGQWKLTLEAWPFRLLDWH